MQANEIDLGKWIMLSVALWTWLQIWIDRISKIVEPVIKKAEDLSRDELLDRSDRKVLVMAAIGEMEKQGYIKLNFLSRIVVGRIVDYVASRLPDFKVSADVNKIVDNARMKANV